MVLVVAAVGGCDATLIVNLLATLPHEIPSLYPINPTVWKVGLGVSHDRDTAPGTSPERPGLGRLPLWGFAPVEQAIQQVEIAVLIGVDQEAVA
jgi:hypothetical protein